MLEDEARPWAFSATPACLALLRVLADGNAPFWACRVPGLALSAGRGRRLCSEGGSRALMETTNLPQLALVLHSRQLRVNRLQKWVLWTIYLVSMTRMIGRIWAQCGAFVGNPVCPGSAARVRDMTELETMGWCRARVRFATR